MNKNNQLTYHDLKTLKILVLRRMRGFETDYNDTHMDRIQSGSSEQDYLDYLQSIINKLEGQEIDLFQYDAATKFNWRQKK
jgi:hypothetical protein